MAGAGSVLTRCFSVHLFTNVYVEIKNLPMQVFERAREKGISGEKQKQGVAVFGCESRKDSSKRSTQPGAACLSRRLVSAKLYLRLQRYC
jgi:hypothetical protein